MVTAWAIAYTTGQEIDFLDIAKVGLLAGLSSACIITDSLAAIMSGVGTFFETYDKYFMGTAVLAAGIDVVISYAGFGATVSKFIPEGELFADSFVTGVFGATDGYIVEGANLLIESVSTPNPQKLVIKELVGKDESAGKPTYVKGGNSCAIK